MKTPRSIILPVFLTNVSIKHTNEQYVANEIFPILNTPEVAKIENFNLGDYFRIESSDIVKGNQSRAKSFSYRKDAIDLKTIRYSAATAITEDDYDYDRRMAEAGIKDSNSLVDGIEFVTDVVSRHKEKRVADLIFGGTFNGVTGGTDAEGLWSPNGATNTFLVDIYAAIKIIKYAAIIKPNRLAIDDDTMTALSQNDELISKFKGTNFGPDVPSSLNAKMLASLLELDKVIVCKAMYSTAKEKADGTDFTGAQIWEKNAGKGFGFLYYYPPQIGRKKVSTGYQARSFLPKANNFRMLRQWTEDAENVDWIELSEKTDIVVTAANSGYLYVDTYAT